MTARLSCTEDKNDCAIQSSGFKRLLTCGLVQLLQPQGVKSASRKRKKDQTKCARSENKLAGDFGSISLQLMAGKLTNVCLEIVKRLETGVKVQRTRTKFQNRAMQHKFRCRKCGQGSTVGDRQSTRDGGRLHHHGGWPKLRSVMHS